MSSSSAKSPACRKLVLDAGPLLSLSPLRGLAGTYLTVPQVLDELQDRKAREHFEQLGLSAGVRVEVRSPDAASLAKVVEAAKKTGDYAVLSHADLCVLALTYALDASEKAAALKEAEKAPSESPASIKPPQQPTAETVPSSDAELAEQLESLVVDDSVEAGAEKDEGEQELEPLGVVLEPIPVEAPEDSAPASSVSDAPTPTPPAAIVEPPATEPPATEPPATEHSPAGLSSAETVYDDPSDSDDGEGEWITPSNVAVHKSRALHLLPSATAAKGKEPAGPLGAGCMTADFAMQNVLLQMGLNLVGLEGKRIDRVKTWVLRCHACFKICKDSSKKFCPSCGNATLLRASVTVGAPTTPGGAPAMQVHLKKNFSYKLRGTIYSIPAPRPGTAKKGTGDGLILREDQAGFARAQKMADARRAREERKMMAGALAAGARGDAGGVAVGSWMDPDWVPEILAVGAGGKGRRMPGHGDLPTIGYGRKNPNERRRKK